MHMNVKMVRSFQPNISHHSFGYPQSSKTCRAGLLWLEPFASIYMVLDTPSALGQQTVGRRSGADGYGQARKMGGAERERKQLKRNG